MAHVKLSPSAAARWMRCPGSVALLDSMPKRPMSTRYADEGTAAHALAEACLNNGKDAAQYLGWWAGQNQRRVGFLVKEKPSQLTAYEVTEEMAEAVQVYLDAVRAVGGPIQTEVKVSVGRWFAYDVWGTCDALVLKDEVLHVFDYKHGAGVLVEAEHNPQAMIYALGGLDAIKLESIRTVRITIVQPRHRNGGVDTWDISAEALSEWGHKALVPCAKRAEEKDAPLVPGDKQCRFCDAKAICPALRDKSLEVAQVAFKDVMEPKTIHLPNPADMTPDQLANVLDFSELLSTWVSAVAGHAEQLALRGTAIPGRKLVRKVTRRAWRDEHVTAKVLAHLGEALYERKLRSPAQIEKLVKDKDAKVALAALWDQPEGELTLAPASDRRAEVRPNSLAAFFDDL